MHLLIIDKTNIAELRKFGLTMSIAFPVIFMGLLPLVFGFGVPVWPAILSVLLLLMYGLFPALLHYPQVVWAWISFVLGWINTRVLLWIVFYLLIFPMGFMARSFGKLNYKSYSRAHSKAVASDMESFWVKREQKPAKQELENPF